MTPLAHTLLDVLATLALVLIFGGVVGGFLAMWRRGE